MAALLDNASAPAKTVAYLRSGVITLVLFSRVDLISEQDGQNSTAQSINFHGMFYWLRRHVLDKHNHTTHVSNHAFVNSNMLPGVSYTPHSHHHLFQRINDFEPGIVPW